MSRVSTARRWNRAALGCSSALYLLAAMPAAAQDAAPEAQLDEAESGTPIVVTGSRIVRRDYNSDSPIITVSEDFLNSSAAVSLDQNLAKLPQFVAGQNQTTSASDFQPNPTSSPGIATVNLRGLGANRTLVLLDGRRT